jgi:hypothetical protein
MITPITDLCPGVNLTVEHQFTDNLSQPGVYRE